MAAGSAASGRSFDHLREHSIGLPQVLFQSITHMAPAAAVAYSIYISVPDARQALPLSVALALIACICAATAVGQLAKLFPSAGGMYTYAGRSLGPWAGFLVAFLFIGFQPLVAPFLYLEFGWAMGEVFKNEVGWSYTGQWWIWVLLMAVIVFLLTYRDIRLSTTAGVILGIFEIGIFAALALWMLFSNVGDLNGQAFNPNHATGDWSGVFKGMVFAILAFIGFEASAPLGEEARHPRRTVPRAVVGSAFAIGIFYVLCAYSWVFAVGLSLLVGWKWNPGTGFGIIATAAVPLVIVVYMLVCVGCLWHYWTERRGEFNPLLHLVLPIGGIVLFFFPLYYQYYKVPPGYPFKYGNWVAIGWAGLGLALTFLVVTLAPHRLRDVDRVYVEDETVAPVEATAAGGSR